MHLYRSFLGIVAVAAVVASPRSQNPPPGFTYQTLVDGALASATAMAFLPDGRLLITERETGRIRQFRNGALDVSPWATIPISTGGSWAEAGLLGIAIDPDFLNNRYVYVYYTAPSGSESHIARLQESGGVGTNLTVLNPPNSLIAATYHNGGSMIFGQDGTLYVGTGDVMNGAYSQLMSSWMGKVLRFAVPNLTIPANNPFPGSPIYSLGHRNHFGLAVHPFTGGIYQTENGGALKDEINLIVAGGNYGWPYYEGNEPQPNPSYTDPLAWYQPTMAPTGCCFYSGDQYPAQYKHDWFFIDYNQGRLRRVTLNATGTAVLAQGSFDQHPGSGYAVKTGPDGHLYVLVNDTGGYGADELGRYVHVSEVLPAAQLSAVSNRALGGSATTCVHAATGSLTARWLSLTRYPVSLPSIFGNVWVPPDTMLPFAMVTSDDRSYIPLPLPNNLSFLGSNLHMQAIVFATNFTFTMTTPTSLLLRG